MLRRVILRAYPRLLVSSSRCSSSTSSSSPVNHSSTSKHVARDGRAFLFATVVVNKMGKGQSAIPAWKHACSLVKANPPTLAIAFISRPTDSALAAIADIAHQFSVTCTNIGGSCYDHGRPPGTPFKAQQMGSDRHSSHDGGLAEVSCFTGHNASTLHSHEFGGATSACNPPAVHETHETLLNLVSVSSMPSSTGPSTSTPTMPCENTCTHRELQLKSVPPLIGCVVADQGRAASMTTSIIRANAAMSDDLFWLEAPEEEGNDSNTGSDAGYGGFVRSNNESTIEGNSSSGDGTSHSRMQSRNAPNMQMLSEKMPINEKWKPSKRNLAINIDEPNSSRSRISDDSESEVSQSQEQPVVLFSEKDGFSEYAVDVRGFGQEGKLFSAKKVACKGEVSGTCTSETLSESVDVDKGNADSKRTCNGQNQGEQETYMLSLCVANMPGVKATGFYTRMACLPWLPDLGTAVTTNHPHMVLLGAPGFNMVDLNELLANMFPNGFRAGASLLSVEEQTVDGSAATEDVKVFCGSKLASSGVVGLSLSPTGEAGFIPTDAFADLVRMSLGKIHGRCWNLHFDETVCMSLFLPQRCKVEWLDAWQRAYKANPDSVRDKIHTKLLNKYRYRSCSHKHQTQMLADDANKLSVILVNQVVFPGFFVPLFIESPCDRLMVKQCMDECKPFGIMSLCTEIPLDPLNCTDLVGTTAKIKMSLFDKGCKSYIIAHGMRRFRIKNKRLDIQLGTFGQRIGQVEFFDDVRCEDDFEKQEAMDLANRAVNLCQNLFPSAASILAAGKQFQDPSVASFAIGHILPVTAEVKKRWLGMVDTKYRLKEQISFLNA